MCAEFGLAFMPNTRVCALPGFLLDPRPYSTLFGAQRLHRVNSCRAGRGQSRRDQRSRKD